MESLDDAEVEAVLGHELTHIRNGDVRLLVIAVVIAGVISFFGEFVFRLLFQGGFSWRSRDDRKSSGAAMAAIALALALVAIAWLLAIFIRFALSRRREFLADAGSVELTKNPDAMIGALRKIEGRGELARANSAVMEMCIDNPRTDFANLFDTHPPIDARVAALVEYAGGHDPGPLALPEPPHPAEDETAEEPAPSGTGPSGAGPWGEATEGTAKPFLPQRPPIELGGPPTGGGEPGPWGPHRKN
jgi:heat shock protein HtpX